MPHSGRVALLIAVVLGITAGCGEDLEPKLKRARKQTRELETQLEETTARLTAERDAIEAALEGLRGTELTQDPVSGETSVDIRSDVLFASGSVELSGRGIRLLKKLSAVMRNSADRKIRVEGYTDATPPSINLKDRYPSNWELGAARASAVVHYLTWTAHIAHTRFMVVSYGQHRPVAGNIRRADRQQNRRVKIVLFGE